MANLIQKMMLRVNPKYIAKINPKDLTEELIEDVFERGYDESLIGKLINTRAFLEYYKKHKTENLNYEIASVFSLISSEYSEEYKHEIVYNSDYVLSGEYVTKELAEDLDLIIKTIERNPSWIDSVNEVESDFINDERVLNALKNSNYTISEKSPSFILNNKEIIYNSLINDPSSEVYITSYIYANNTHEGMLSKEESVDIANAVIDKNYVPKYMLKKDSKIANEIIKLNPYLIEPSMYTYKSYPPNYIYNEEDVHIFVNSGNISNELKRNFDIVSKCNKLDYKLNYHNEKAIYNACKENGYVLTSESPFYLKMNPYLVMDALESGNMNLDEVSIEILPLPNDIEVRIMNYLEAHDKVIASKIGEKFSKSKNMQHSSNNLKSFSNASEKNLLTSADYKQRSDPDFIMESIRINFESIRYAMASIEQFSKDQQKEITKLYFEYGIEKDLFELHDIGKQLINDNQYVLYEKYKRGELISSNERITDDELLKEMAENYWNTKGFELSAESNELEIMNPYILEKSLEINPQTIDFTQIEITAELQEKYRKYVNEGKYKISINTPINLFSIEERERAIAENYWAENGTLLTKDASNEEMSNSFIKKRSFEEHPETIDYIYTEVNDEMAEKYYNLIREGKYIVTNNTPLALLNNPLIKDYLLRDINNIKFYHKDVKNDNSLHERIDEAIKNDSFTFDDIIPPIYIRGNTINYDVVEYILSKNIHNIERMNYINDDYIINLIDNNIYKIDENANLNFLSNSKQVFMAAFRKNNSIIFMDEFKDKDVKKLTIEEMDEIAKAVDDNYVINENTPNILKNNIFVIRKSLENDIESAKHCKAIIDGDIKNLIINSGIEYSKDMPQLLRMNHPQKPLEDYEIYNILLKDITLIKDYYEDYEESILKMDNYFISRALTEGVILDAKYPEFMKQNIDLVLRTLEHNWSFIEDVSPLINLDEISKNKMIELAIKNNYIINENSFYFFKRSPTLVLNAIKNNENFDINDVDYVDFSKCTEEEMEQFEKIILDAINENKYKISEYTPLKIRHNKEIILNQIEKDITVLQAYEQQLFTLTKEEQIRVYELYLSQKENLKNEESLKNIMLKNTFFVMDYIQEHLDEIDNISFDGLILTDEFKNDVSKKLLENGYIVNANTPMFIRNNPEFVYQYLIKNNLEFNGLENRDIAPLLMLDALKENPKYIDLYKLLEDGKLCSDALIYMRAFGPEKTLKYSKYGNIIRYIDTQKEYSSEDEILKSLEKLTNRKEKYLLMYDLGKDFILDDNIFGLYDLIKIKPELLDKYYGKNEKILQLAIDEGYFENKSYEDVIKYMERNLTLNESTILMKYLIDNKSVEYFNMYKGDSEDVFELAITNGFFEGKTQSEIEEYILNNKNASKSAKLINYLIDNKSVEYFKFYNGNSEEVFENIIFKNYFVGRTKDEIKEFMSEKQNISCSTCLMKYLIENYDNEIFDYYRGNDTYLFEYVLEKGYVLSPDVFKNNDNFKNNIVMVNEAIKLDPYLFAYANARDNERILFDVLKLIAGEEHYNKLISGKDIEEQLQDLYDVGTTIETKIRILKMFSPQILNIIGYKNDDLEFGYDINTLVKYAINNPMLDEFIQILNNNKYDDFIEFYKHAEQFINDDSAIGINKFLHFSALYNVNPNLCIEILEEIKGGHKLTNQEISNFNTILYKNTIDNKEELHFKNLSNLLEKENKKYDSNLKKCKKIDDINNDLFKYLFGYSNEDIEELLNKNMNTLILNTIINRAKEDNNAELRIVAEQANVIFEIIEQIKYYDGDINKLKEKAKKIYEAPIEEIYKIRAACGNLKEIIRNVYEVEAQTELNNLDEIIAAGEYSTVVGASDIKVIDLSNKKHTIYGHVLGTSIDVFFDTQIGKVTICLSAETDVHEAYYYEGENNIRLGFTKIPQGNYIGASTQNMGSNEFIETNDYRTDNVEKLFNQRSIRNLYEKNTLGKTHSEILAYRKDLIPTCIIMNGDVPTEKEILAARELKQKIKEVTGEDVDIPLVKTQHAHKRVINYKNPILNSNNITMAEDVTKIQNEIEKLREGFLNIISLDQDLIRKDFSNGEYIIENREAYIINEVTEEHMQKLHTIETQRAIQSVVHGEGKETCLETKKRKIKGQEVIATKLVDAESVYSYSRGEQNLSKSSSSTLLKEFMVDHLMCCYSTDNDDILLDGNGKIYRKGGEQALENLDDFENEKGEIYTNMSYLYFEEQGGNNIYRKVFENYIYNPDESEILSQSDFDEFFESAKRVQEMDDDEYIRIFKETIEKSNNPELMKRMILKRKQTIVKESEEFVNRIQKTRRIEQNPEKFESTESIAIINDIHGNLAALESILEDCKKNGKKDVFILGDMIGFGPQSDECIELIRTKGSELNVRCILGNHELYSLMGNKNFTSGVDEYTVQTRRSLSDENRRYIESLPMTRKIEVAGKMIELAHYLYKKDEKNDVDIYTGHGKIVESLDFKSNVNCFVYGHEHGTESNVGDEVGEIRQHNVGNILCINLPSSGCVHGKRTTYVTLNNENGLRFDVNEISYDKEKNDRAVRSRSPEKADFFGVEIE